MICELISVSPFFGHQKKKKLVLCQYQLWFHYLLTPTLTEKEPFHPKADSLVELGPEQDPYDLLLNSVIEESRNIAY